MIKKPVTIVSLILIASFLVIGFAVPPNWYEAANVTGVVVQTATGIVKATINLGSIQSVSGFSGSGSGTITIAEAGGLNVTRFSMTNAGPYDWAQYYPQRFTSFTVDLTIDSNVWQMPIVVNGAMSPQWDGIVDSYTCYRLGWTKYHLSQGTHPISFTVYGTTQIVSANLAISFNIFLELSAA